MYGKEAGGWVRHFQQHSHMLVITRLRRKTLGHLLTLLYIHIHIHLKKKNTKLTQGSQKSCNIYTSKHYVYMCKACVHGVHTHLLGNVETLSGVYLSVEKVNCIRK